MSTYWIDAAEFKNKGGWYLDTQFVYEMGGASVSYCGRSALILNL